MTLKYDDFVKLFFINYTLKLDKGNICQTIELKILV